MKLKYCTHEYFISVPSIPSILKFRGKLISGNTDIKFHTIFALFLNLSFKIKKFTSKLYLILLITVLNQIMQTTVNAHFFVYLFIYEEYT